MKTGRGPACVKGPFDREREVGGEGRRGEREGGEREMECLH